MYITLHVQGRFAGVMSIISLRSLIYICSLYINESSPRGIIQLICLWLLRFPIDFKDNCISASTYQGNFRILFTAGSDLYTKYEFCLVTLFVSMAPFCTVYDVNMC